jgi:hypothetical protein
MNGKDLLAIIVGIVFFVSVCYLIKGVFDYFHYLQVHTFVDTNDMTTFIKKWEWWVLLP